MSNKVIYEDSYWFTGNNPTKDGNYNPIDYSGVYWVTWKFPNTDTTVTEAVWDDKNEIWLTYHDLEPFHKDVTVIAYAEFMQPEKYK